MNVFFNSNEDFKINYVHLDRATGEWRTDGVSGRGRKSLCRKFGVSREALSAFLAKRPHQSWVMIFRHRVVVTGKYSDHEGPLKHEHLIDVLTGDEIRFRWT